MNKSLVVLFIFQLFFFGCTSTSKKSGIESFKVEMNLEDKSGKFTVVRESGVGSDKKSFVSKYRVFSYEETGKKVLEQSIVFSVPGFLNKKFPLLRPDKSQYRVWFDGKLYQSETFVEVKTKSLVVKLESPESQWSGTKKYVFPGGNGVFCYFSQLVECIDYSGFIRKAIKSKAGKMNFHVIWDGFPYVQEQYLNIANEPFSPALLEYDGRTKEGENRFSLTVSGNVIFYLFSDQYDYAKVFWPSQGLSLYHK